MIKRKDYLNNLVIEYLKSKKLKIAISDVKNCSIDEFKNKVFHYKSKLEKIWNKTPKNNRGVAILLDRNSDYIAIIFASWLANGFYLPLSLTSPKKNIKYQLENSGITATVSYKKNRIYFSSYKSKKSLPKIIKNNYKKIAYIIFTSGSTGQKKGVCISRNNLISYLKSIKKIFKKKFSAKSVLISGELTFDISSADLVFALLFKCEIILTNDSRNLLSFIQKLEERKAESIYVVPSTLEKFIDILKRFKNINLDHLKQLNCGGEILPFNLVKKISKKIPNAKIFNFYGPTEFTINSTYFEVKKNMSQKTTIPIGKPLPGNKYYIKTNKKKNRDFGELYLTGKQKMLGYVNYPDPTKKINGNKFYPTGDIVTLDKRKNLIFCGRNKDYVKVSGYRVNLNRVENIIRTQINLSCAVVSSRGKIILFINKLKTNKNLVLNKLKILFKNQLETYEVPFKTIFLKNLPINENGKVDKKKLILQIN